MNVDAFRKPGSRPVDQSKDEHSRTPIKNPPFRTASNKMTRKYLNSCGFGRLCKMTALAAFSLGAALEIAAQTPAVKNPSQEPAETAALWYLTLFVLFLSLTGAIIWLLKTKKAEKEAPGKPAEKSKPVAREEGWDADSLDADREMEWFRRHRKTVGKLQTPKKKLSENLPPTSKVPARRETAPEQTFSENEIKQKLADLQLAQLPVFKMSRLEPARPFAPLSISNDQALMSAIEQTQDEFEEDEAVRDLAVRILAAFKTRNSVEALSQIALYDLSSNVRSKAVGILADFDHESVFETILQACADPTREVRAAAARGLFRLNFDRADAWTRIAETNDVFRMRQATRAAIEADLVSRSFDRLVHSDQKVACEAVTLLALMIRAEETEPIFKALEGHREQNVKLALLKVVELTKDEKMLAGLYELLEKNNLAPEVKSKIDEMIRNFELIVA
jgi:hypothetical protein